MNAEQDRLIRQELSSLLYGGDLDGAAAGCLSHLQRRPRDHEAMALLAHVYLMAKQFREAETTLTKALRLENRRADYYTLMGEILTTTGRHREALGRYDRALKLDPGLDSAIAGKAETYLRMGKPDRAIRVIEQASRKAADTPLLAIVAARALIRLDLPDQAESLVRGLLPGRSLPAEQRRGLWFAAGLAAERQGDLDGAWTAYEEANACVDIPWSSEESESMLDAARSVFTPRGYPHLPRTEIDDQSPIFIVGMLRSGSTLTEQIIDAHPSAAGLGEILTLASLAESFSTMLDTALPYPAALGETNERGLTAVGHAYLKETSRLAPRATRRVDKQLGNFTLLGLIPLLFPRARIIHCRRHPLDIGLSCWCQRFAPGTTGWSTTLSGIATFHHQYENWMEFWKTTLPVPILEVRYEDLIADLEGQSRRIIDFCDLPWDERCLRFWESGRTVLTLSSDQVRQPLYRGSVGRHAIWGDRLDPLRDALAESIERYENAE